MKTNTLFSALLLFTGLTLVGSARANEIVKPTTAPVVSGGAEQSTVDEPAVIDHVVYLAHLPSPDELMKSAELKGTPIVRMDQTADRIVVVYQYAGGRTVTFAYTLLSLSASTHQPVAQQPPSNTEYHVVTPAPAPPSTTTVVYTQPDTVYYAPRVAYYNPAWDFWTPLVIGVGLGWGFGAHGYYGHAYYGGHGYYGHGHGGHH